MDLEFSRNPPELPHPSPPHSSRSSSRCSSINSEKLYQIDHKAIPRKPGSARFRVLPNIIAKEISDKDKEEEVVQTSVTERDVQKRDMRKPKEMGGNERERKVQEKKDRPKDTKLLEEGRTNKGQNSAYFLKHNAAAKLETRLSKKSQQIQNRSGQTTDDKPAKETNEKWSKPVQVVGSCPNDSKNVIYPMNGILPQEPGQGEKQITLAVKLPSGERFQQSFRLSDPLHVILKFAESSSRCDFTGCELVCFEPKVVLQNMRKTIRQANLHNKTVLYIQLPEPK